MDLGLWHTPHSKLYVLKNKKNMQKHYPRDSVRSKRMSEVHQNNSISIPLTIINLVRKYHKGSQVSQPSIRLTWDTRGIFTTEPSPILNYTNLHILKPPIWLYVNRPTVSVLTFFPLPEPARPLLSLQRCEIFPKGGVNSFIIT